MKSLAKLLLLLFVTSSVYRSASAASTKVGATNDTDTVDILGEQVNEMSYSDIEEMLGNSNKSDHFVVVNEENIDEELSETKRSDLTGVVVIIVILAIGPILFIITAILYCLVLAYEKCQKKRSNGGEGEGEASQDRTENIG